MKIALTFDVERDIPNVLNTYFGTRFGLIKILKILDDFNIKGTFFCTGNVANHLPQYIKLINHKGHEIGCHGLAHERLSQLNYKDCEKIIEQNKQILEKICQDEEIVGFRAPYLKTPNYLFTILKSLGFKYDSSIKTHKLKAQKPKTNKEIQEFHPNFNIIFRLPLLYPSLRNWIFKRELLVLYLHPWEAIKMKTILFSHTNTLDLLNNALFRPDRWISTGDMFLSRFKNFLRESLTNKAEFVMLKQLLQ
ncbi:MAG: polysaccharide deacetylase family protein [Candidatus Heimdallarchaeota archaeon]